MNQIQAKPPGKRFTLGASGLGLGLIALALLVHPIFYFPALVTFSLPLLKTPGQRPWGWAGLVFALVAAIIMGGYTIGRDMALRDNAVSERTPAN